ncbi:hypothetical protein IscW_ISCW019094 [Ixodes scapularis]|uniref:Uncharacterized protein n=1 Tax=Ixodes scapularis TaxID=6945 RepID=B7PQ16_IXOSC|nr:hypothetical protein IscW_ISCW019094 [Ixodes scapularis]|eukprot:XP_002435858.1 hypothetical protein IscW_ISCW019094 [Ixodes scapularis]
MLEYKLTRATNTSATLAHIAGAIDAPELEPEHHTAYVLRAPRIQSSGNRQLTHCRRQELFNNLNNAELKQQVVYFSTALAYKGLIADNREREAKEAVDNIMGLLNNKMGDLSRFANDRDICYRITDENEPPCETPTDLYLVLDTSQDVATNEIYRKLQSEILGVITRQLKFENGVSTLRVYGSKRDGTLLQELARHSAAGGCPACAALFLTDMERNAVGADSETDVFNTLNEAITNHKKAREEMHGVAIPAALQYKNSMSRDSRLRSESQATFEGFVTPRTVQYWSYDTEFYSASSYLQIKFTAGNGSPVRVCDLTGRVIDGNLAGRMCYETSNQRMYGAGVLSAVFSPLMLLLTALALSRNALHS